ncbi:hypothetical protein SAMN04487820_110219 [Actinopolyspora mzabensis]|uniref:Uncharacterized protein n=1 Tax=Actinopolyspora mzabensis TaxID=995066 RepID=A0A1G9DPB0_ACTMZ|nr:hypothetical protein SAMN04487820_110219 [Actinopolyspora mzabensis]
MSGSGAAVLVIRVSPAGIGNRPAGRGRGETGRAVDGPAPEVGVSTVSGRGLHGAQTCEDAGEQVRVRAVERERAVRRGPTG